MAGAQPLAAQPTAPQPAPSTQNSAPLPNLGDATELSPSAERRLGDRIARELYRDTDYIDDPVIMEYVQAIWQPLLAAARQRGDLSPELDEHFAWEILMGKDRSVNAFALPGAYLGLHLGLVGVVTNRDELASVLAHELSHVTQRHISRMISRQGQVAPWLMGAMILGALAATGGGAGATAAIVGGQAVAAQSQLNFSRDMEREADRVGFGVSTQAGFEAEGFVSMFGKLQQASRLNDSGGFPYLRSHPLTTERMADMQSRIPGVAANSSLAAKAMTLEHALIAARARVLSNPGVDSLRNWAVQADAATLARQPAAQQAGVLYGATLAAVKLREFSSAQVQGQRLLATVKNDPASRRLALLLGAESWLAQGSVPRATAMLQMIPKTAKSYSASRAELFLMAQAAAQDHSSAQALSLASQSLRTWVSSHPRDAQAWQLLSTVYGAQGKNLSAIRAGAEVNMAQLDYASAVTRFKAAQDWVRQGQPGSDHIEASIVDTRLREAESALREQSLER
jgi:predicted Zn-dependent protease